MLVLILLVASVLVLRLTGYPLAVLGLSSPVRRLAELGVGLAVAAAAVAARYHLLAEWSGFQWAVNPDFTLEDLVYGLGWNARSVGFEELLFRGVLLFLAIRTLGLHAGCLLSAAAFGIYHWFSYEVMGQVVQMAYAFSFTFAFGLMLAYAYARTWGLFFPFGLHLGWNLGAGLVFSDGPLGAQWLIAVGDGRMLTTHEQLLLSSIPLVLVIAVILGARSYGQMMERRARWHWKDVISGKPRDR